MIVNKGEIIFHQDQEGHQAFLIESGQVEIYYTHSNGDISTLALLTQGEIFGEMALIDSNVRSASAKATTDCQLMVISKEQLLDKLENSDPTIRLIMKILLSRLRSRNKSQAAAINQSQKLDSENAIDHLKFEHQLNEAFKKNEFVIYHQPIVDISTGKLIGSEALVRWDSPNKGLVPPGQFIDILENSSMIIPVGYWIIEECFKHSKLISKKFPKLNFSISINVSGRQFANALFIETLEKLVQQNSIDPKNFKLEVTERILMEGGAAIDVLSKCRQIGFEISLDDFGTGFSSLQYLPMLPIDYIKVDRSFVMNILTNSKTKSVVDSMIYLARKLNLKIIAEGIENEKEQKILQKMGADLGQGYFFSKPMPLDELLSKL